MLSQFKVYITALEVLQGGYPPCSKKQWKTGVIGEIEVLHVELVGGIVDVPS